LVALPFVVLVRGALWGYEHIGLNPWLALTAAVLATALILLAYCVAIGWRLTGRLMVSRWMHRAAFGCVAAYAAYGVVYLAADHAKSDAVRSGYRSLHPLLRVAASTFVLLDRDAVLTDLARQPADYARMGLPVEEQSRHYTQPDGYVHALDVRTIGRPWWRNALATGYFRAMGFATLRHVGTADHLHVWLP
jgi:hypothetical protein